MVCTTGIDKTERKSYDILKINLRSGYSPSLKNKMTNLKIMNLSNFIKSIFKYIPLLGAIVFGVSSCTEDLDVSNGIVYSDQDDYIKLNFVIPEAEHVITRANDNNDERLINDLTILIFPSEDKNATLLHQEDVELSGISDINLESNERNTFSYKFSYEKADASLYYYAIANASGLISEFTQTSEKKISDLEALTSTMFKYNKGGFIMSGAVLESSNNVTIPLTRSAAKVTLKDENAKDLFELTGFSMQTANSCYITAGAEGSVNKLMDNKESKIQGNRIDGTDGSVRYDAYSNPTVTYTDDLNGNVEFKTYLVIKGNYDGKETFYAVPIFDKASNQYFNIEPNHWYDIRISEVSRGGYDSEDEALRYPMMDYVTYEIHDHVSDVYSMISDGIHELGVPLNVTLAALGEKDESDQTLVQNDFDVRCYTVINDFSSTDVIATVTKGTDWLEIVGTPTITDQTTDDLECDKLGKILKYTVKVKDPSKINTDKEGEITIKWKGLERKVPITYTTGFNPEAVVSVKLTIIGDGNSYFIGDYGPFIRGNGTPGQREQSQYVTEDTADHPNLFGITSKGGQLNDMLADDKLRSQGFHFPMPYGNNAPWQYEYDVDLEELCIEGNKEKISGITATVTGSYFQGENKVVWTYPHPKFKDIKTKGKLTFPTSGNDPTYAVGSIKFTIHYEGITETSEVTFALYHTGFFHWEDNTNVKKNNSTDPDFTYVPAKEIGYYYYEVVKMGDSYWLDRNLGAKSNKMFIDTKIEDNLIGTKEAIGRFYTIAYSPGDYENPTFTTFHANICPPGYRVPITSEWNDVRLSEDFITESATSSGNISYITAYYQTKNAGKVYFPKARYYQEVNTYNETQKYRTEVNSGDAASGYYWTQTLAPGMEKEKMGKWLRVLYINGASSTYMNGSVLDHKMNVRCVLGKENEVDQKNHYISFNVHEVTHVYIFDENSQSPLYSFPGKAVCSNESAHYWQYFSCTTTANLNSLRVIFTRLDNKGKITIYSKDGKKFSSTRKLNEIMASPETIKDYSWPIIDRKVEDSDEIEEKGVQGKSIDFCDVGADRDNNVLEDQPNDCGQSGSGGNANFKPEEPNIEKIIWKGNEPFSGWNQKIYLDSKYINWSEYKAGSKLKIYINISSDNKNIQACFNDWSKLIDDSDPRESHISGDIYVAEVIISQTDIEHIIKDGQLTLQGNSCTVLAVTIIAGNGEDGGDSGDNDTEGNNTGEGKPALPLNPNNHSEQVLWEGQHNFAGWIEFRDLFDKYNWIEVPEESIIKVYCAPTKQLDWWCISFRKGSSAVQEIDGSSQINNPNGYCEYTLTKERLKTIISNQGIVLQGYETAMTKITITPPNN